MNFDLSDDERLLTEGALRWVVQSYSWDRRQLSAAEGGFEESVWQEMAAMGWLAAIFNADLGGLGLRLEQFMLILTELGRGLVVEPLITNAVVCAHLLNCSAENARASSLAAAIASGNAKAALGMPERGDAGARPIVASQGSDGYVLQGALALVVDAGAADHYLVGAEVEGEDGISLFLVERAASGLEIKPYSLVDGRSAGDLMLHGVRVDREARILSGALTQAIIEEAIDMGAAARLAELVGGMDACLASSVQHLKDRRQFGQPLANFQVLQHLGAEMFVEYYQSQSMLYYLMSRLRTPSAAQALSEAKTFICKSAELVSRHAMQAHGAIAFTQEFKIGHYYKRVVVTTKLAGDENFHYDRLVQLDRA